MLNKGPFDTVRVRGTGIDRADVRHTAGDEIVQLITAIPYFEISLNCTLPLNKSTPFAPVESIRSKANSWSNQQSPPKRGKQFTGNKVLLQCVLVDSSAHHDQVDSVNRLPLRVGVEPLIGTADDGDVLQWVTIDQ